MKRFAFAALLVALTAAGCAGPAATQSSSNAPHNLESLVPAFSFGKVNPSGFEPRVAIGPDGTRWVSTAEAGKEVVYRSQNGLNWTKTGTDPQVIMPNADNEIVVTPTGRVITATIAQGVTFDIQYTDDGGETWTKSQGNYGEDQDREWLAVGGKDTITGQYDVYMLWHNLVSGTAQHEMFVATSRDNGATFGPSVPIALPPSQAYTDLQCADSGGPSNIFANNVTGQVYAVFGTRSSVAGGCGSAVTGAVEINIVAATRTWVATSKDQGLTWTDVLAVDDSVAGNIVGMQVNAGTVDNQGNVYVVYPESPKPFPDYDGAAVKYVWAPADLGHWSKPVTVQAADDGTHPGTGSLLTHIAAGDPGKVSVFYMHGEPNGTSNWWYPTVSTTYDGLNATPAFTTQHVGFPAWNSTASKLMGVCQPLGQTALDGFACGRSSDVYGQAIGADCDPIFVWYGSAVKGGGPAGTFTTQLTDGPKLCAKAAPRLPAVAQT